jgi:hypothetical protein
MKHKQLRYFLFSIIFLASCYTGKNALKHGQYDQAVYESVQRLRSKPTNSKATAILKEAYPQAIRFHMDRIKTFNLGNEIYRYDNIINEYEALNRMYDQIMLCPAAMRITNPVRYTVEINDYKLKSAQLHYETGVKYLDKH